MVTLSLVVARQEAVSREVCSSIEHHGPECVSTLDSLLFPGTSPGTLTTATLFDVLKQFLKTKTDSLVESDRAVALEQSDDEPCRSARDTSIAGLREMVGRSRETLRGALGTQAVTDYGFSGETPINPDLLKSFASNAVSLLKTRSTTTDLSSEFATVNTEKMAASIEPLIAELDKNLKNVKSEERKYQLALENRDKISGEWTIVYTHVATITSSLFALAGRKNLADRVRPTNRKSSGQEDVPVEPEKVAPEKDEPKKEVQSA